MLAELFNTLKTFVVDHSTQTPKRLADLETHKRERLFWDPKSQTVEVIEAPPPSRMQAVRDLPSLIGLVAYAHANKQAFGDSTAAVWIGLDAIKIVFDDLGKREHFAKLPYVRTPIWEVIEALRKCSLVQQKDAIRLLRTTFQEFDANSNALTACKNLSLQTGTNTESEINNTNRRMSRTVLQEAAGGGNLPETLNVLAVPFMGLVWPDAEPFAGYHVEIFLEIDFDNEAFNFEPNEQHVHDALEREALRLQQLVIDQLALVNCEHVPVLIGNSGDFQ